MSIKKIATLTLIAAALTASLAGCSPTDTEKTKEETTSSDRGYKSEVKPDALKPSKELASFHKDIDPYIDLKSFDKDWTQLTRVPKEVSANGWYAVMKAEDSQKLSKYLLDSKEFASSKDSAPETAEGQLERENKGAPEEDLLQMGGIITLKDGKTLSISVSPEGDSKNKMGHWSFFID